MEFGAEDYCRKVDLKFGANAMPNSQIVGRERRGRVSQLDSSGDA